MEEKKDFNLVIGKNLHILRKNMKLTQLELAEKFNYSDKSISKWEKGESLPSVEVLCELAQFYGVTLDYLTKENENSEDAEIKKETKVSKEKPPRVFPARLMITLLSVGVVWFLATFLFVALKLTLDINYFMSFMWAGVLSCVVLIVFNSIWGKMRYLFPILTLMLWLFLASVHLQIYLPTGLNTWPVYFLGIPLQVLIILWAGLVKKPKWFYKNQKAKSKE